MGEQNHHQNQQQQQHTSTSTSAGNSQFFSPSFRMMTVAMEEEQLMADAKYRAYQAQVDRALRSFEQTSEWADLISALTKLGKVLVSNVKYPVIPRRLTISKRLAQCLHPNLPAGVHMKALETYNIIFNCIEMDRLAQELFIYSAGLFPLLSNAAMNVRSKLLELYETHFVPLQEKLRPGLNGFLVGVLPGLEEGSDHYERTDRLLTEVSLGVEKSYFYGCLWKCVLCNTSIRLPAINFVIAHFDKKMSMDDQLYIMGTDIDCMVEALSASLQDSSVLVQRSALDLLLITFPLHNCQLVHSDTVRLCTASLMVLLRRDMSVNRRLFTWLFGDAGSAIQAKLSPGSHAIAQRQQSLSTLSSMDYFKQYAAAITMEALRRILNGGPVCMTATSNHWSPLYPYRIMFSLMDRREITSVILSDILIDVFRCLHHEISRLMGEKQAIVNVGHQHAVSTGGTTSNIDGKVKSPTSGTVLGRRGSRKEDRQTEVAKTANIFFSSLEPSYLWSFIADQFQGSCERAIRDPNRDSSATAAEDAQTAPLRPRVSRGHSRQSSAGNAALAAQQQQPSVVQRVGAGLPTFRELCALIEFALDVIALDTFVETSTEYLPDLLVRMSSCLVEFCNSLNPIELKSSLLLCSRLLSKVQPPLEDAVTTKSVSENEGVSSTSSKLAKCIESFQELYFHFMEQRMLVDPEKCARQFKQSVALREASAANPQDVNFKLLLEKNLLGDASLKEQPRKTPDQATRTRNASNRTKNQLEEVRLATLAKELQDAYTVLCRLMVELSSFPVCLSNAHTILEGRITLGSGLPRWLSHLVMVSCFSDDIPIMLCTLGMALDLIGISRTTAMALSARLQQSTCPAEQHHHQPQGQRNSSIPTTTTMDRKSISTTMNNSTATLLPVVTSVHQFTPDAGGSAAAAVVSVPVLHPLELHYLMRQTKLIELATLRLWSLLEPDKSQYHIRLVQLLQQISNLSPDDLQCEKVLCEALTSECDNDQAEAQKKFAILWHLSRDVKPVSNVGANNTRYFDRCLFQMLDYLSRETCSHSSIARTWFHHALHRDDLARILEPLTLVLFHPDTARVSVQHVSVRRSKNAIPPITATTAVSSNNQKEDHGSAASDEGRIYAISSVGGNVVYHVTSHLTGEAMMAARLQAVRNAADGASPAKVFALTSAGADGSTANRCSTGYSPVQDIEFPASIDANRQLQQPMQLIVNPIFGSETSLDQIGSPSGGNLDFSNAIRFDSKTTGRLSCDGGSGGSGPGSQPGGTETAEVVGAIISDILDQVCGPGQTTVVHTPTGNDEYYHMPLQGENTTVDPLHSHMLLYWQVYDSEKTLHALHLVKVIIRTAPRVCLCAMATTSVNASGSKRGNQLQVLLARHRKCMMGNNYHGELGADALTCFRSSMYLEVLVSACLYFIRGYYPNLPQSHLSAKEIAGNCCVRLRACDLLRIIFEELALILKDGGSKAFFVYIADLLHSCKVQKVLLHCLVASVYNFQMVSPDTKDVFTFNLVDFNERSPPGDHESSRANFQETFQSDLLDLMRALIVLEDRVTSAVGVEPPATGSGTGSPAAASGHAAAASAAFEKMQKVKFKPHMSSLKYQPNVTITSQAMFGTAILIALKQTHRAHLHAHWIQLVLVSLRYAGRSLTQLVITVTHQICNNLENVITTVKTGTATTAVPPDYLLNIIEGLTALVHHCLLDSNIGNATTPLATTGASGGSGSQALSTGGHGVGMTQIVSNLISAFSSTDAQKQANSQQTSVSKEIFLATRRSLLTNLSRIFTSLVIVWECVTKAEAEGGYLLQLLSVMGSPKTVKQQILSFLSPISVSQQEPFLTAVATVWHERRGKHSSKLRKVIPLWSPNQLLVIELVSAIKVLPIVSIIQVTRTMLKQVPPVGTIDRKKQNQPVQVSMLQFLLAYIQSAPGNLLMESFPALLQLWKDGVSHASNSPPVLFYLLALLHEFVQKAPGLEERKDQKSLQEASQSLIEACSSVAGASLEQTTWLRRNLVVKSGPQQEPGAMDNDTDVEDGIRWNRAVSATSPPSGASPAVNSTLATRPHSISVTSEKTTPLSSPSHKRFSTNHDAASVLSHNSQLTSISNASSINSSGPTSGASSVEFYSVQALCILAEFLAPVLDVVYVVDDKEKMLPLLNNIMHFVTPYLKNHSQNNVPSFRACSQLIATISGYQLTRKAWRAATLDLLLDPAFFQMDAPCMAHWRLIVDHLMTHDKTTFKEFMTRTSTTTTGGLNIFSNKEQEHELRAAQLKRLAFVIFCSEADQYHKHMPDIQERVVESIKLSQVPLVQAQQFVVFRVLLLRMSPQHVTMLWPGIVTELVQAFLHMEQVLTASTEGYGAITKSLQAMDSGWAANSSASALESALTHPHYLALYLSACKLLDMAMTLPTDTLPQFQMYRWAFTGDSAPLSSETSRSAEQTAEFIPHIKRICALMDKKNVNRQPLRHTPGKPLLFRTTINSLYELHDFFTTILYIDQRGRHNPGGDDPPTLSPSITLGSLITEPETHTEPIHNIERVLEADFLECRPK